MDDFDITSDSDLREYFRALTLYDDTADEIQKSTLNTQISVAKLKLKNEANSTEWYSDSGLGQALLGTVLILGKAAIENYSVSRWDLGDAEIDVSGASDSEQVQFEEWATLVSDGLKASNVDSGTQTPQFTKTFGGYNGR